MSFAQLQESLTAGHALDEAGVRSMAAILLDASGDIQIKAELLRALSAKGETPAEIAAFVRAFLDHAVRPPLDPATLERPAIDICGTGGDKLNLFNVSTTSMFVLAACGVAVVKHGNRGITSKSGGADVLEALGIRIDLPPEQFAECVKRHGAAFMLAPQYHPAFAAVGPVRRLLAAEGTRTLFNIIGPLLNPLQPAYQLAGVFDPALPPTYAGILQSLGRTRAWAVHGTTADGQGMDEVSTLGPTRIVVAEPDGIREESITLSASPASLTDLQGGDAPQNAAILAGILDGSDRGPRRELVLANTAAALQVTGTASSWEEALALADEAVDSGKALAVLHALQQFGRTAHPG
jgi:anthranilate phosphoribosyltransferase